MAVQGHRLTAIADLAVPTRDDLIYIVNDPGGVPTSFRATVQAIIGGPEILVAASDASALATKNADYVCDGTADEVEIEAAIAALPAGGGRIRLSDGTFNIEDTIDLVDNMELVGNVTTTIVCQGIANDFDPILLDRIDNVRVAQLRIDGNGQVGKHGVYLLSATNAVVERVTIHDCYHDGFAPGRAAGETVGCQNVTFSDCVAYDAREDGWDIEGVSQNIRMDRCTAYDCGNGVIVNGVEVILGQKTSDVTISQGYFYNNTYQGVMINSAARVTVDSTLMTGNSPGLHVLTASDVCIVNCECVENNTQGILVSVATSRCTISTCIASLNANRGIEISSSNDIVVSDAIVNGNSTAASSYDELVISGTSQRVIVHGCRFITPDAGTRAIYWIRERDTADYNQIYDCSFIGTPTTGTVIKAGTGTHTRIRRNMGFIALGESRSDGGMLTAGVANAIALAWHNPEAQDILIKKVVVYVTTVGGTVGSHLDVGIADDAAGTNRGVEFFDDLLLNTGQVNDSSVAGDGGTQTKWVFCQDSASATDGWIVGQILDANAANLVGRYYIEYEGR